MSYDAVKICPLVSSDWYRRMEGSAVKNNKLQTVLTISFVAFMMFLAAGCGGSPSFATSCCYDPNPQQAASKAVAEAVEKLKGKPVKGLIFAVYYEKASFTPKEPGDYMPDVERECIAAETIARIAKELAVKQELGEKPTEKKQYPVVPPTVTETSPASKPAEEPASQPAVAATNPADKAAAEKAAKEAAKAAAKLAAKKEAAEKEAARRAAAEKALAERIDKIQPLPNIGLRARAFVDGHEMQPNSVAVLAVAGDTECTAVKIPILADRGKTGQLLAYSVKKMENIKLVFVFSEMNLNFAPEAQGKTQAFIDKALAGLPKNVVLFGGNSMNNPADKQNILAGGQYFNGHQASGSIVAMAIAGNMKVFTDQANEFTAVPRTVLVTESRGPWVITLDDRPAAEVYRRIADMPANEKFTSDWQHPIGIPVSRNKIYLQMVTNWIDKDGKDKDGKKLPLPAGSLRFRSDIPYGTQICVLTGGNDSQKILDSLRDCTKSAIEQAHDSGYKPSLILVCECCARNMRLEAMRDASSKNSANVLTRVAGKNSPAIFGFYAFGHFAPIGGTFLKSSTHFQQHVVTSIVVAE